MFCDPCHEFSARREVIGAAGALFKYVKTSKEEQRKFDCI
jgi:hypothetical protein